MQIQNIGVSRLRGASFNPPGRTTEVALRSLLASIEAEGILSPIHVRPRPDGDFDIGDGHRRAACARALGHKSVPCIVHAKSESLAALWSELTSKGRQTTSYEWMVAWRLSDGEVKPPAPTMHAIKTCRSLLGTDGIDLLIERGVGPGMFRAVYLVSAALDRYGMGEFPKRKIGLWIARHRLQGEVATLFKLPPRRTIVAKIVTRIRRDEPFTARQMVVTKSRVGTEGDDE
jgi:hypothetical protein